MKAYLDSTKTRSAAWNTSFPGIFDVFESEHALPENITHVFFHRTDLCIGTVDYADSLAQLLSEGRGLIGIENQNASARAVQLLKWLNENRNSHLTPWLIVYSGEPLDENKRETIARDFSEMLGGYPTARIRCIETPIDRIISEVGLAERIREFLEGLEAVERICESQACTVNDPNTLIERRKLELECSLAVRLLCEAWEITGSAEKCKVIGDVVIHAPTTPVDWFKPFGKNDPTSDDAKEILDLLVGAENEGTALFEAVFKKNNNAVIGNLAMRVLEKLRQPQTSRNILP